MAAALLSCSRTEVSGNGTASSTSSFRPVYEDYFTTERLRTDIIFAGDSDNLSCYFDAAYKEPRWSGSPDFLIDTTLYGTYYYEVFSGDTLIFSNGFAPLFDEWRTTEQARTLPMASGHALWMPFPKRPVEIVLYQRERATGRFQPLLSFNLDPTDRHIISGAQNNYPVSKLIYNGDPSRKLDIVLAAEGYTLEQMPKFRADCRRLADYFLSMEPYKSRGDDINFWMVESPSAESGVDIPQAGQWRQTAMDSGFDTFYTDRYLTIQDHRKIASVVSGAPFDAILVVANETKYGGGGFYNSYAIGTSGNRFTEEVWIHEFGHSFAGLGDEYYDSEVAVEDFYPAGIEPWEPNITNLTDFASKWQDMLPEEYEGILPNDASYIDTLGLFEGAGYMTYGCYRPYLECRMLNNTAEGFCPVCRRAISRAIDRYSK